MIVFEEKLGRILDLLPPSKSADDAEFKVWYNWGTQDVLNKYLVTESALTRYPLIWLTNGEDSTNVMSKYVTRNARLVIAMHSDKQDNFNPDIYATDYDVVLNPLLKNVIVALQSSGASWIGEDYTVQRLPNYSVVQNQNNTVDVWNAIVLDIEITIDNNCLVSNIKF